VESVLESPCRRAETADVRDAAATPISLWSFAEVDAAELALKEPPDVASMFAALATDWLLVRSSAIVRELAARLWLEDPRTVALARCAREDVAELDMSSVILRDAAVVAL